VVHGDIGISQQRLGLVAAAGDADADADEHLVPVDPEARLEPVDDALRHPRGIRAAAEHDRELVAAHARAYVFFAEAPPQAVGDCGQELVADEVPERIVTSLNRSRSRNSTVTGSPPRRREQARARAGRAARTGSPGRSGDQLSAW